MRAAAFIFAIAFSTVCISEAYAQVDTSTDADYELISKARVANRGAPTVVGSWLDKYGCVYVFRKDGTGKYHTASFDDPFIWKQRGEKIKLRQSEFSKLPEYFEISADGSKLTHFRTRESAWEDRDNTATLTKQ